MHGLRPCLFGAAAPLSVCPASGARVAARRLPSRRTAAVTSSTVPRAAAAWRWCGCPPMAGACSINAALRAAGVGMTKEALLRAALQDLVREGSLRRLRRGLSSSRRRPQRQWPSSAATFAGQVAPPAPGDGQEPRSAAQALLRLLAHEPSPSLAKAGTRPSLTSFRKAWRVRWGAPSKCGCWREVAWSDRSLRARQRLGRLNAHPSEPSGQVRPSLGQ